MSIKLRALAEMDAEYAKELKQFFSGQNMNNYLDMTIEDFIKFCTEKVGAWNQQIMEVVKKLGNGRNHNL